MQHSAVQQCAVIAQQNPTQHLASYVVPQVGKEVSSRELRSYLMEKLPHYMVPGTVAVLEKFPLTPNGKIDKQALALIKITETTKGYVPPKTAAEVQLADIWAEVLKVERVGTTDDFFELGGHSLLATQLLSRVQSSFGTQIPLRRFFENATIAGLAEEIDDRLQDRTHSASLAIPRRAKGLNIPLSFAQQRLWFLHEMEPGSVAYNIPAEVRLQGKLKVEALRQSLEQIVERHEVLRTRFEIVGEQPCQIIAENVPFELSPLDLTSLAAQAREKTLDDLRAQEASTPFDLRRGPVFRAKLIKWRRRFCSVIHHAPYRQ
jgi:acyl carrier protein